MNGRRIGLLLAALTAALLAAFALVVMASNNPAQAAPTIVTVAANDSDGLPTGINIDAGDRVVITATGKTSDGTGGTVDLGGKVDLDNTGGCNPDVSPDGAGPAAGAGSPLPSEKFGALLGRIGTSGDWFLVGSGTSFTASTSGELYLIVNDTLYTDNCDSFKAKST
jgi:hypothetical protein